MSGNLNKSATTGLRITFQGRNYDIRSDTEIYTVKYVGTYDLCMEGMNNYVIGAVGEYGTVEEVKVTQQDEAWWNLEVTYETDSINASFHLGGDDDTSSKAAKGTSKTATRSELTCRMMSMPLEYKLNYRKCWNNNLYTNTGSSVVPAWWSTAGAFFIPPEGYYFAKSFSECPSHWTGNIICIALMTMPGVESFDLPVYELTESSRHNKKDDASWTITRRVGCIATPIKGDFDIVERFGGNWLCEGGSVRWDGKKWAAQLNYTWSPNGWNPLLYTWS